MAEEAVVGSLFGILKMFGVMGVVRLVFFLGMALETEQKSCFRSSEEEGPLPARRLLRVAGRLVMARDTGDLSARQREFLRDLHLLWGDVHHVDIVDRFWMARPAQLNVVSSVEQVLAGGLFSLYVTLVTVYGRSVNIGSFDIGLLFWGLLVSLLPCRRERCRLPFRSIHKRWGRIDLADGLLSDRLHHERTKCQETKAKV